jgi:hypothetical protein
MKYARVIVATFSADDTPGGNGFMIPPWESATPARAGKFDRARPHLARFRPVCGLGPPTHGLGRCGGSNP